MMTTENIYIFLSITPLSGRPDTFIESKIVISLSFVKNIYKNKINSTSVFIKVKIKSKK